jgi:hypothetical protein
VVVLVRDVYHCPQSGEGSEKGCVSDSGYRERHLLRFTLTAMVKFNVSDKRITLLRRELAMCFVSAVTTIFHAVANKQLTDTLRLKATTLEVLLIACFIFELLDTICERFGFDLKLRIKTFVEFFVYVMKSSC